MIDKEYFPVMLTTDDVHFSVSIPQSLIKYFGSQHEFYYSWLKNYPTQIAWAIIRSRVATAGKISKKVWIVDEVQSDIAKGTIDDPSGGGGKNIGENFGLTTLSQSRKVLKKITLLAIWTLMPWKLFQLISLRKKGLCLS